MMGKLCYATHFDKVWGVKVYDKWPTDTTRLGGGVAGGGLAPDTRLSPVSDGSQSPGPGPPHQSPGVQRLSCPWPRLLDTPLTFTITDKIHFLRWVTVARSQSSRVQEYRGTEVLLPLALSKKIIIMGFIFTMLVSYLVWQDSDTSKNP